MEKSVASFLECLYVSQEQIPGESFYDLVQSLITHFIIRLNCNVIICNGIPNTTWMRYYPLPKRIIDTIINFGK